MADPCGINRTEMTASGILTLRTPKAVPKAIKTVSNLTIIKAGMY